MNINHIINFGFYPASPQINQKNLAAVVNQNQLLLEDDDKLQFNPSVSLQSMNLSLVSWMSVGGHFLGNDSTIKHPICNENSSPKERGIH